MVEYRLVDGSNRLRYKYSGWRILAFSLLCLTTISIIFVSWNLVYETHVKYPLNLNYVPDLCYRRAYLYANSNHKDTNLSHDFRLIKNQLIRTKTKNTTDSTSTNSSILATDQLNYKNAHKTSDHVVDPINEQRLVCYYVIPPPKAQNANLLLKSVRDNLCTHINIGFGEVENSSIVLTNELIYTLINDVPELRAKNSNLKILIWVGGGDSSYGFPLMIKNHANRKLFIKSVKHVLEKYHLDGIDLDWEFPSAYDKERMHFSQLLYEIKKEFKLERKDYILSVAVAAPEGIALFAYDVGELNKYADHVNLMTYDYHFYTQGTPFTGLNAPLYAREKEHSIMGTLNINYSVNWWLNSGLDRNKLVVGLPTYGHSFTLVNPFNKAIGAPASNIGQCGQKGFTTYSEICWFYANNLFVSTFFDEKTCSPFLSAASEWISFENEKSIECKTRYVKSNNLGGVMVFSLNSDDFNSYCQNVWPVEERRNVTKNVAFPLIETVKRILGNK